MKPGPPIDRASELWQRFSASVAALPDIVMAGAPNDELHAAEGIRYLMRYLSAGIAMCVEHDDVDHPEIGTLIENRRSWGLDNPDTKYGFTRVTPGGCYRISGSPGSARHLELQVNTGHFADGDFTGWRALSRWSTDDIVTEADGSVVIEIAPERPDGATNWMATGPDASYLHVREYFSDWANEEPACFVVERVGESPTASQLDLDTLERRMDLLDLWLDVGARCWAELGSGFASGSANDITPFVPSLTATGLGGQAYGMGTYVCGPDEAVIVEFTPPVARYWSLSLATWFWESADIANRSCSINDHTATIDPDGHVRAVISHGDPGCANWLDPAGYVRGTLAVRYLLANSVPTVSLRTIPFDALNEEMTTGALAGSATLDSAGRAEQIRTRRVGLAKRYRR